MHVDEREYPAGLTSEWAGSVLDGLLDGVARSHSCLGGRFPLYRAPGTEWVSSRRGSWTGGHWTGLLWLRALRFGHPEDRGRAEVAHLALEQWAEADTATRGLIFWYPLVLSRAVPLDHRERLEAGAGRCSRSLLARFSAEDEVIPWGEALGGPGNLVRVDGAPGVAPLMCRAPGTTPESARAGVRHLLRHLHLCGKTRGSRPVWWLKDGTPRPDGASTRYWSRGRAWLLTAFADALTVGAMPADDPDLAGLLGERAPLIPVADAQEPGAGPDTGAAAIEAAALLRLARRVSGPELKCRVGERAHRIVRCLVERHLTERGRGLAGGSYEARGRFLTGLETVWGDFHLALAAAMIAGVVSPEWL